MDTEFYDGIDVEFESTTTTITTRNKKSSATKEPDVGRLCQSEMSLLPEELLDVPTFKQTKCCASHLIEATRQLFRKRLEQQSGGANGSDLYQFDIDSVLSDDWVVSRFLLRCRLDPGRACNQIEQLGRFRREHKMGEIKYRHFPLEFFKILGSFAYEPDTAGNTTLWVRVKVHRRIPELMRLYKQYMLCVMEDCDLKGNRRGLTVVVDCTHTGFKNADPQFALWMVTTFRSIFPKALTYLLVLNLTRGMKALIGLALAWLSPTNKRKLRFVNGDELYRYIDRSNVPKSCGGTCTKDIRKIPEGCVRAKVLKDDPQSLIEISEIELKRLEEHCTEIDQLYGLD